MMFNYNKFVGIFFVILIVFSFLKIYQHNLLIKETYEYQRLVKNKLQLKRERNELKVQIALIRNAEAILSFAENTFHMKPLKPSQVLVLDNQISGFDFLSTSSDSMIIKELGLYDLLFGITGGLYAGT
jgi:hypothetical protein